MRKVFQVFTLVLFALLMCLSTVNAQVTVGRAEEKAPQSTFGSKLWYGGNIGLGFASNTFQSQFDIGIAPMVGYKIFDQFSIGPRASLFYSHIRFNFGGGDVQTANPITWSLGAFTRYKIFRTIFLHAEYEFENRPVIDPFSNDLNILRDQRTNAYLGGGYNSGERFGYEIMVLYNVLQPDNDLRSPFVIRFGFTYNF